MVQEHVPQNKACGGRDSSKCPLGRAHVRGFGREVAPDAMNCTKGGISMPCNNCETGFQQYQTVVVSIQKSGITALLYVQNQGRNIVRMRRILLCYTGQGGTTTLYLRPSPDPISWIYPSAFLETGITALYYQLNNIAAGAIVQAQAEYIEVDGRSRSCPTTF
jgi:hypothetical protein